MTNFTYSRNFKGVADVFLRSPNLYRPLVQFIENVMVGESDLSKEEREIIAAHVSRINECRFCVEVHRATLSAMGVDDATTSTLEAGPDVEGVRDAVRHLMVFAEKLTTAPADVTAADVDALRKKGISEQTVEDTVNVVSLFNYVNRLVDAFGVEGSPEYFEMVGASLAKNGYAPLLRQAAA